MITWHLLLNTGLLRGSLLSFTGENLLNNILLVKFYRIKIVEILMTQQR